jgi:hypothetical protein
MQWSVGKFEDFDSFSYKIAELFGRPSQSPQTRTLKTLRTRTQRAQWLNPRQKTFLIFYINISNVG